MYKKVVLIITFLSFSVSLTFGDSFMSKKDKIFLVEGYCQKYISKNRKDLPLEIIAIIVNYSFYKEYAGFDEVFYLLLKKREGVTFSKYFLFPVDSQSFVILESFVEGAGNFPLLQYFKIQRREIVKVDEKQFDDHAKQPSAFLSLKYKGRRYDLIGYQQGSIAFFSPAKKNKTLSFFSKRHKVSIDRLYDMGGGKFLSLDHEKIIGCWDIATKKYLRWYDLSKIYHLSLFSSIYVVSRCEFVVVVNDQQKYLDSKQNGCMVVKFSILKNTPTYLKGPSIQKSIIASLQEKMIFWDYHESSRSYIYDFLKEKYSEVSFCKYYKENKKLSDRKVWFLESKKQFIVSHSSIVRDNYRRFSLEWHFQLCKIKHSDQGDKVESIDSKKTSYLGTKPDFILLGKYLVMNTNFRPNLLRVLPIK